MEQKHKKFQWLFLFWLAVFIGLGIAANQLPMLTKIDESREISYTHPYDNYTLDITGTWQVYKEKSQELTLVDLNGDSTIHFTLEVGGTDYQTLSSCAKATMKAVTAEQDITFDPDSIAVADGNYDGIRFAGTATKNDETYIEDFTIYHPNVGIRLYAVYTHPKSTSTDEIDVAKSVISSVIFLDFNQTYKDYLH